MDIKSKTGPFIAIMAVVVIVLWMVSGGQGVTTALADDEQATETAQTTPSDSEALEAQGGNTQDTEKGNEKRVQAMAIAAENTPAQITLSGTTEASDTLSLQASYSGKITKIYFQKGDEVKQGQTVLSIDTRALNADIRKARALVEEKKLDLEAASRLVTQKLSSKVSLASAKSALASAEADLQRLLVDAENAQTKAPFSGILNDVNVNEGQLVQSGDKVADLIALQPLVISAQIPQKTINQVTLDTPVIVDVGSDEAITGNISFVNKLADENTRSVEVEIEIPNPNNTIPAGISAIMSLQLPDQLAHGFSPALLTLNDAGDTAVKVLDENNIVQVAPIQILRSDREQVWVTGLPSTANIITVGQGFVDAGDHVVAQYKDTTELNTPE